VSAADSRISVREAALQSAGLLKSAAEALGTDLVVCDPSGREVVRFAADEAPIRAPQEPSLHECRPESPDISARLAESAQCPIEGNGERIGSLYAAVSAPRCGSLIAALAREVGERYQVEQDLDQMTDQLGSCYDEINLLYRFKRVMEPGSSFKAITHILLHEVSGLLDGRHLVVFHQGSDNRISDREAAHVAGGAMTWLSTSRGVLRQIFEGMCGSIPDSSAVPGVRHAGMFGSPHGEIFYVVVPLRCRDDTAGFVGLFRAGGEPSFDTGELRLMESLADELSAAATTRRLYDDLQEMLFNTIRGMVAAIDAKDEYTRGHSERVYRISMLIGRRMDLPDEDLKTLSWAALLHDIGKIAVSGSILNKPGRLTDNEFAIIKSHPERGCRVLEPIPQLGPTLPVIRAHHERYDGNGYPDRLRGGDIPLAARIIAVADTFDAIVSTRAYRKARGIGLAVAEIGRCSGSQFDPAVVRVFLDLASEGCLESPESGPVHEMAA